MKKKPYRVVTWCLANNIETICNDMHKDGYDVISVEQQRLDGRGMSHFVIVGKDKCIYVEK